MKQHYIKVKLNAFIHSIAMFFASFAFSATIYVNNADVTLAGDIYCGAIGNDANSGLASNLPKLTLNAALAIANNGDIIYVDTGSYSGALNRSLAINKEVQIIGAGEGNTVFDNALNTQRWATITANNVKISKLTVTRFALATDGIALAITSGTNIELNRVLIYANVGSAGQGAVFISGTTTSVTIKNSGSPCNRVAAANYGGGYKIDGSTVLFDNCSINNNIVSAIQGGGILIIGNTANVTINNTTFDDNEAAAGGAICIQNGTVNINNCCFNGNTTNAGAGNNLGGGAILVQASTNGTTTNINVNNCSFTNNSTGPASSDGGAVSVVNLNSPTCNLTFLTCSFANNNAQDKGEDVFFDLINAPVFNVIFRNNSFLSVYSGTQVNLYNQDFSAAFIKFEQQAGLGANGDIVADGSGVSISKPEMTGVYTESSTVLPVGLPVTRCYDRFDGACGTTSATMACITENSWNGATWSRGTAPTVYEHVILNANYNTLTHGNINACQMTVKSGVTLDIVDGTNGTYVYVVNSIFNSGTINVSSKGNLVQVNHPNDLNNEPIVTPSINFTKNTGNKIRWDYIYWSKPIANAVLSNYATNFDLKYFWDPDFCIAGIDHSYLGWQFLSSEPSVGTGFITRVKTAAGLTPTNIQLNYSGLSNNGDYSATIKYYDTNDNAFRNFTLLGNPYPGAIKFENFYNDNRDKIYGTVYLWSANTPYPGSGEYQQADYASFNLTGGVGVAGASTQSPNGILPNGYIASAQGFMVRPKVNGTVTFKNSQRTKDIPSNNQFYRSQAVTSTNSTKDRYWLRITDESGRYNEQLIGYLPESSLDFDEAYDGPINSLATLKFYSKLGQEKLVIQSRGAFSETDTLSIAYESSIQKSHYQISMTQKEGVFENQAVYIHDKLLNFYQNLQDGAYIFCPTSDDKNRFEIIYKTKQREIVNQVNEGINILAYQNQLEVTSFEPISSVKVFDLQGKLVLEKYPQTNTTHVQSALVLTQGVYLVTVDTHNKTNKTTKILIQ